jgi:hypothetical protein
MSETFVVRNQLGQYWGKKKKWADGTNPRRVKTCHHQDEAVNLLVELSARDIDLRGEVLAVELDTRGLPEVQPSEHLIPEEPELAEHDDAPGEGENAVTGEAAVPVTAQQPQDGQA